MRKLFSLLFLISTLSLFSQNVYKSGVQAFQKPNEGKALVYIIKSGAGALLNFRVYKDDKFLGAISSSKYLIIECDPGNHMFWAASENRDFIETTLQANKVYVINLEGQMGAFIASVAIKQLDPNKKPQKNLFYRTLKNSNAVVYNSMRPPFDDKTENIKKGLDKYNELKSKNSSKILKLNPLFNFENGDKFIKK
jgi:hypothetical protein